MIEIPVALAIAAWAVLAALGFLVIVLYRQLAYLLNLGRSTATGGGLPLGDRAPQFEYLIRDGGEQRPARFSPGEAPTLLLFANPGCSSCETMLAAFDRAAGRGKNRGVRFVAFTDASPDEIAHFAAFANADVELGYVSQAVPTRLYRAAATPFLVALDQKGRVRDQGPLAHESDIRRAVRTLKEGGHDRESELLARNGNVQEARR